MRRISKYLAMFFMVCMVLAVAETTLDLPITQVRVEAHSGRTDSSGGHKDNKNKSGLGSYHYHCGGYPAHLHPDGVCPYATTATDTQTTSSTAVTTNNSASVKKYKATKTDIENVQTALNLLGYDCGTPDGKLGKNTKKRIKEYQEFVGQTADGVVDEELLTSLGLK